MPSCAVLASTTRRPTGEQFRRRDWADFLAPQIDECAPAQSARQSRRRAKSKKKRVLDQSSSTAKTNKSALTCGQKPSCARTPSMSVATFCPFTSMKPEVGETKPHNTSRSQHQTADKQRTVYRRAFAAAIVSEQAENLQRKARKCTAASVFSTSARIYSTRFTSPCNMSRDK